MYTDNISPLHKKNKTKKQSPFFALIHALTKTDGWVLKGQIQACTQGKFNHLDHNGMYG